VLGRTDHTGLSCWYCENLDVSSSSSSNRRTHANWSPATATKQQSRSTHVVNHRSDDNLTCHKVLTRNGHTINGHIPPCPTYLASNLHAMPVAAGGTNSTRLFICTWTTKPGTLVPPPLLVPRALLPLLLLWPNCAVGVMSAGSSPLPCRGSNKFTHTVIRALQVVCLHVFRASLSFLLSSLGLPWFSSLAACSEHSTAVPLYPVLKYPPACAMYQAGGDVVFHRGQLASHASPKGCSKTLWWREHRLITASAGHLATLTDSLARLPRAA